MGSLLFFSYQPPSNKNSDRRLSRACFDDPVIHVGHQNGHSGHFLMMTKKPGHGSGQVVNRDGPGLKDPGFNSCSCQTFFQENPPFQDLFKGQKIKKKI